MTTPETIKQIKTQLAKAYWRYLYAPNENKLNMLYWYTGMKQISVLFISDDEITEIEDETEDKFIKANITSMREIISDEGKLKE